MTTLAKHKPAAKPRAAAKRKPAAARKPRPTIEGLLRIIGNDPLPPQDQLPENPVLVQRGSISV